MKIYFASSNENKVKELNSMLSGIYEVYGLSQLGIVEDIPENGETFEENSRIKAKYIYDQYAVPVIADDSGLLVDALNGAPGVYSARYAGLQKDDHENMSLLLENLSGEENRTAEFRTVVTLIEADGKAHQFIGSVTGEITLQRRGTNGFGYDPIFQPNGYDHTYAELPSDIKNSISHRAEAVQELIQYLRPTQ